MEVAAFVALGVVAAALLGALALAVLRRARAPHWSHESDTAAAYALRDALPLRNVRYVARAKLENPLDVGRLSEMRTFRAGHDGIAFTHAELARRFHELESAVERYLSFVDERAEGDGDLRRFPVAWKAERPEEWRALATRWMDVADDVTICHEELFRAARRLLGLRRPPDKSDVLA